MLRPERRPQRKERRSHGATFPAHNHLWTPNSKTLHYSPPCVDKDQTLINQDDDCQRTDEEAGSDDDAYFHWDEEETLLSDLLEDAYAPEISLVQPSISRLNRCLYLSVHRNSGMPVWLN